VVTKCDERAKQATKFRNAIIIENRRKSEATKLEAAKVEVLLYPELHTCRAMKADSKINGYELEDRASRLAG
jgi:hypothetical protein